MLTENDRKRYRISIDGLKHQRQTLHIRMSKLERDFKKEMKKLEVGLVKSVELEEELREEMRSASGLPF